MSEKKHFAHSDRDERGRYLKGVPRKRSERKRRSPGKTYDDIIRTFELIGGTREMARWARNHRTVFYSQVMVRALPQAVMQRILLEAEPEAGRPLITFVEAEASEYRDRVSQLEKLLKEHDIGLPPMPNPALLPEYEHECIDISQEGQTEDEHIKQGQ